MFLTKLVHGECEDLGREASLIKVFDSEALIELPYTLDTIPRNGLARLLLAQLQVTLCSTRADALRLAWSQRLAEPSS